MEQTLIIIKPDALQRGIVGEIITRFERVGLKVVGMKMLKPSSKHYHEHYEKISQLISRRGKDVYDVNLDFMMVGPVIVFVLEGLGAVTLVRKMVGATESASAAPGTIRGDYSHVGFKHANSVGTGIPNLVHASGDEKEAALEIKLWFSSDELYDYSVTHEPYTQPAAPYKKHTA